MHGLRDVAGALVLVSLAGFQDVHAVDGAEKLDLKNFPGTFIEEVIVPVPSEIFAVLDKLGQPNWRAEMREQNNENLQGRYELALQFGVVVADGFIAVQAQDKQKVKNIGHEVLRLADRLVVKDAVLQHAQSIMNSADAGDFEAVRLELDKTQRTVREEMEKIRDEELSQCVSIGGWLRGTEVVTSVIGKAYTNDKAELLYQPDLVGHFEKTIKGMQDDVRTSPKMKHILAGLSRTRAAMATAQQNGLIPQPAVNEIHQICTALVEEITHGK